MATVYEEEHFGPEQLLPWSHKAAPLELGDAPKVLQVLFSLAESERISLDFG